MDSPKRRRQRMNARDGGAPAVDAQMRIARDFPDVDRKRARESAANVTVSPNGSVRVG